MQRISILLIFALFCGKLNAQSNFDTVSVSDELNHLKKCMYQYSKQHTIGATVAIAGVGISAISFVAANNQNTLLAIGGAACLIGTVIMFDSNKWFKRASMNIGANGLSVRYKF